MVLQLPSHHATHTPHFKTAPHMWPLNLLGEHRHNLPTKISKGRLPLLNHNHKPKYSHNKPSNHKHKASLTLAYQLLPNKEGNNLSFSSSFPLHQ